MFYRIFSLYSNPTAQVRINGSLSDSFSLHNGTRQGCPLSPLLFAISLEPFLATIRNNRSINGIRVGTRVHKYAAYADDILFFIQQPRISLPNLMSEFSSFQTLSNFKINLSKSEILNITVPQPIADQLKPLFPFRWEPARMKYLGIYLTPHLHSLFRHNYIPLLNTIKDDLRKWSSFSHSWLGKVNIIKMNILPRVLFILQMIPIKVPMDFFTLLQHFLRPNAPGDYLYPILKRTIKQSYFHV